MGKFPSHDFHRIVGKFTEDTGDTDACPHPPTVTAGCSTPSGKISNYLKFICRWEKILKFYLCCDSVEFREAPLNQEVGGTNPVENFVISFLDFSEISEGRWVKCFRKFPKGGGLNRL
jgi:hypothetical protein